MFRLILDAGPLITTCKFSVAGKLIIDHLLEQCQITVTTLEGRDFGEGPVEYDLQKVLDATDESTPGI